MILFLWSLQDLPRLGWFAALAFAIACALRLARFNTQLDIADKRYFTGLPSPAAASLVASLVWAFSLYQVEGGDVMWLAWIVTMFAGFSMVSNFRFYSGKDINLRKSVPFSAVVASVNNMGPGLNEIGPAGNYAGLTGPQLWICSLAMLLGRLEMLSFLVLFTRGYWRK